MNAREVAFRSSHLSLSQSDDRFWQWSFHQIGYYDLAAVIHLVLNTTGVAKVPLLAYSQGFMSSLVLLSMRPEYNEKIDILLGYAHVANLSHAKFPLPQLIAISDPAFFLLDPLGDSGYLYIPDAPRAVVKLICGVLAGQPCSVFFAITQFTSQDQLNKTRMPVILSHCPIGTSFQNLRHFVQVYRAMNFVMFDYGSMENKKRYGQTEPPAYPVEKVTVPVALFSSQGDTVAAPGDVEALAVSLGSDLLFNHVLSDTDFSHVDFLSGYQARVLLYEPMINALKNRTVGGF